MDSAARRQINSAPAPLTPPTCDLRDFPRMMIDIARLFLSDFNASASRQPLAWMIGHKLWYRSWHQVPAGSLPDDDETLCHLVELGFDVKSFRKSKPLAMRGWIKCADGRLYHPVVAEAALEAWLEKLNQRISSGAGNASRWKIAFDREAVEADISHAVDLLRLINPQSRSIGKALRKASGRDKPAIPPGQKIDPGGTPEDPENHPKGQRKGKEKGQGQGTLEKETAADAAAAGDAIDPEKLMFDSGRQLLADAGHSDGKARSLLGKWKQAWGAEAVIVALGKAKREGAEEPISFIEACLKRGGRNGQRSGPEQFRDPLLQRMVEGRDPFLDEHGRPR